MGITQTSLDRINRYIKTGDSILILGCQNLYNTDNYGEIAHSYFEQKQHNVFSLDILGCQGSKAMDLREVLDLCQVDLVLQHGTVEHIDGSLYQPFKNIHDACKVGGVMIHENPMVGNWPGHGYHYFTEEFYTAIADALNYEVLELTKEAAMGNVKDGWNISCVFCKISDNPFIAEQQFNEIYGKFIFPK